MAIGFLIEQPTHHYENNEAATNFVKDHRITPRLKHIDLLLCLLHYENNFGTFEVTKLASRFMLPDYLRKPKSGPSLLRLSSWAHGHYYLSSLPE